MGYGMTYLGKLRGACVTSPKTAFFMVERWVTLLIIHSMMFWVILTKGCDIMTEHARWMSWFIYFRLFNCFPQSSIIVTVFCNGWFQKTYSTMPPSDNNPNCWTPVQRSASDTEESTCLVDHTCSFAVWEEWTFFTSWRGVSSPLGSH